MVAVSAVGVGGGGGGGWEGADEGVGSGEAPALAEGGGGRGLIGTDGLERIEAPDWSNVDPPSLPRGGGGWGGGAAVEGGNIPGNALRFRMPIPTTIITIMTITPTNNIKVILENKDISVPFS